MTNDSGRRRYSEGVIVTVPLLNLWAGERANG